MVLVPPGCAGPGDGCPADSMALRLASPRLCRRTSAVLESLGRNDLRALHQKLRPRACPTCETCTVPTVRVALRLTRFMPGWVACDTARPYLGADTGLGT